MAKFVDYRFGIVLYRIENISDRYRFRKDMLYASTHMPESLALESALPKISAYRHRASPSPN
jgi:hypothetical protein